MPIFPFEKDHITYLVVLKNTRAIGEMALDLAREIEIPVSTTTQLLTSYFQSSTNRLVETKGIFHVNFPGASNRVKEMCHLAEETSKHTLFKYVLEWLENDDCAIHTALSGIMFSGIKTMVRDTQGHLVVLSVLQDFCTTKENSVEIHLDGISFYDGWFDDGMETFSMLDCLPKGEQYLVWRLYPERTCMPILGFIDFCRHQHYIQSLDAWLSENNKSPMAKVVSQVKETEEMLLFLDSIFI